MKHLITNITALLLLAMTLPPAVAYGANGDLITTISGIKYTVFNETDKTAQADLSGATGDVVIPETVKSSAGTVYSVNAFTGESAKNNTLTSVVFPKSCTSLAGFRYFSALRKITAKYVTNLGNHFLQCDKSKTHNNYDYLEFGTESSGITFSGTGPLSRIYVKDLVLGRVTSATTENDLAYCKITNLKIDGLSSGFQGSKYSAFSNNTTIDNVIISSKEMGNGLVYMFKAAKVKSVTGSEVTSIPSYIFNGLKNLESVSFDKAAKIGDGAFKGCTGLTAVSLPSVTTLSSYVFMGCTNLKEVSFDKVTTLGNDAFKDCSGLTKASLKSVKELPVGCFAGCNSLASLSDVNIPNVTALPDSCFSDNCLKQITDDDIAHFNSFGKYCFSYNKVISSLTLNNDISNKLSEGIFSYWTNLRTLSMNDVTSLPDKCFDNDNGGLINSLSLNSVIKLGDYCFNRAINQGFDHSSHNVTITLPKAKYLGKYCFNARVIENSSVGISKPGGSDNNLITVDLPEALTLDDECFAGNNQLVEINIPKVTKLGNYCFSRCISLKKAVFPCVEEVGDWTFNGNDSMTEVNLPKAKELGVGAFDHNKLVSVILPEVTEVKEGPNGAFTFSNGGHIKDLYMPKLKTLASNMFSSGGAGPLDGNVNFESVTEMCGDNVSLGSTFDPVVFDMPNLEHVYELKNGEKVITDKISTNNNPAYVNLGNFAGEVSWSGGSRPIKSILMPKVTKISANIGSPTLTKLDISSVSNVDDLTFMSHPNITELSVKNGDVLRRLVWRIISDGTYAKGYADEGSFIDDYMKYSGTSLTREQVEGTLKNIALNVTLEGPGDVFPTNSTVDPSKPVSENYFGGLNTANLTVGKNATVGNASLFYGLKNMASVQTNGKENDGNFTNGVKVVYDVRNARNWLVCYPAKYENKNAKGETSTEYAVDSEAGVGPYAFANNTTLDKVILGDNGRDVEDHAFYNSKINNVRFNDTGLENIGSNAFANMDDIMYVHLPYSVSTLGAGAFENSKNLLAVELHDTKVTEIGDNTFAGLTAITSIALPDEVTTIGKNAFKGNKAMTYFTVPASCTQIGEDAFSGTAMEYLNIPAYNSTMAASLTAAFANASKKPTIFTPAAYADSYKDMGFNVVTSRSMTLPTGQYSEFTRSYPVSIRWTYRNVDGRSSAHAVRFFRVNDDKLDELDLNDEDVYILKLEELSDNELKYIPANTPLLIWCSEDAGYTPTVTWSMRSPNSAKEKYWKDLFENENNPLVGTPASARLDQFVYEPNFFKATAIEDYEYENFVFDTKDVPTGYYTAASMITSDTDTKALIEGEKCYLRLLLDPSMPDLPVDNNGSSAAKKIKIRFVVDHSNTTGIADINDDWQMENGTDSNRWYRMDGTSTEGKPSAAGVYIHNGRKVVIK